LLCTGNGVEVALDDGFGRRQCAPCLIGPGGVTGMQDDLMPLIDE